MIGTVGCSCNIRCSCDRYSAHALPFKKARTWAHGDAVRGVDRAVADVVEAKPVDPVLSHAWAQHTGFIQRVRAVSCSPDRPAAFCSRPPAKQLTRPMASEERGTRNSCRRNIRAGADGNGTSEHEAQGLPPAGTGLGATHIASCRARGSMSPACGPCPRPCRS